MASLSTPKLSSIDTLRTYQTKGFNITNVEGRKYGEVYHTVVTLKAERFTSLGAIVECCLPCFNCVSNGDAIEGKASLLREVETQELIFERSVVQNYNHLIRILGEQKSTGPGTPLLTQKK